MIVEMRKVYVVARQGDRKRLLETLRELGAVHLVPVDADKAFAGERAAAAIDELARARQILSQIEPAGGTPDVTPREAAGEALRIQRTSAERNSRLSTLHRQAGRLAVWGDVTVRQFTDLRAAGIDIRFYSVPAAEVPGVRAECVQVVAELPGKQALVAVVARDGEPELPATAKPVELPARDRPSLRAEAAAIDADLQADADRLRQLAHHADAMAVEQAQLQQHAELTIADRGGLDQANLFAIQGWAPAERSEALSDDLAAAGLDAAVETAPPAEDETPPTLIRYPKWALPIKGLFDILGTLPGYREVDLAGFFMVALPLFAAMLIGDAGYGLVFLLVPALLYRRMVAAAGKNATHLLMVFGAFALVWGVLSGNYFGITPETIAKAGGWMTLGADGKTEITDLEAMAAANGLLAGLGTLTARVAVVWDPVSDTARQLVMKISFVIATVHLSFGQLRKALAEAPNLRTLASVGWAIFLWGMLGIVWYLMFLGIENLNMAIVGWPLGIGYALVLLFSSPARNPIKRLLTGLASSLLPLLGTFSDTMSYIRLMAVGLASYYIADAFNGLGATLAGAIGWYSLLPILVILFGHLLNLGLAAIAIFAHGVRLNMLEFSNNAGVQWAGHAYLPFAKTVKEI